MRKSTPVDNTTSCMMSGMLFVLIGVFMIVLMSAGFLKAILFTGVVFALMMFGVQLLEALVGGASSFLSMFASKESKPLPKHRGIENQKHPPAANTKTTPYQKTGNKWRDFWNRPY